jgi:hypothetical protein
LWFLPAVLMAGLSSCAVEPADKKEPVTEISEAKDSAVKSKRAPKVRPESPSKHLGDLVFLKDVSERWLVLFGFETQGKWLPKLRDGNDKAANRVAFDRSLMPGDFFFHDEPMKNRFKFIKFEERVVYFERLNVEEKLRYAIFEDQKATKKGKRYEIPNRLPKVEQFRYHHFDRSALLSLDGTGLDDDPFSVEEGARFALSPGSKKEVFLLKSVTPKEIIVEWNEQGQVREKTIGLSNAAFEPPKTIRDVLKGEE